MARAVSEIYEDIQALTASEKKDLLRTLVADLDAPADPEVEKAWLEEAQRRYQDLAEGKVKGVPGKLVVERVRSRLGR
jgi:putative addiction module component (TIGR02574 family)